MIRRVCQQCLESYQTYPSVKPLYCSSRCAGLAKRAGGGIIACKVCGAEVYSFPSKPRQYCSKSCARTAANLTAANPSYNRDITGERNPMYGKGLSGEANPMYGRRKECAPHWKGGRKVRDDGYILIVAPDDHPYPADGHAGSGLKYILEHRRVMELHLGRYLTPEEVVHHDDENPSNNALDNLVLFSSQAEHIRVAHSSPTRPSP